MKLRRDTGGLRVSLYLGITAEDLLRGSRERAPAVPEEGAHGAPAA